MSDFLVEKPTHALLPELANTEEEFQRKIHEFIMKSIMPLSWALIAAVAFSVVAPEKTQKNSSSSDELITPSTAQSEFIIDLVPQQKITNDFEELDLQFQKGQEVLATKDGASNNGVISQVLYLSDKLTTQVSYIIVDFPDGSWDGFDPEQLEILTQ